MYNSPSEVKMRLTMEEKKQYHDHIVKFADYAEAIVNTIEASNENKELQLQLAVPVIEQTAQMVDLLSDTFLDIVESGREPNAQDIRVFEAEIRKLFASIISVTRQVQKISDTK